MGGAREMLLMNKLKTQHPEFNPVSIVDVGANKGEWSKGARYLYPNSTILMVEATEDKRPILEQVKLDIGNSDFAIGVLSQHANQSVRFYQGGDTGNSMYKENTWFYAEDKPVERITSTLDIEIEKSPVNIHEVSIIKIDVQGAEGIVLQGATKALQSATFVHLEVSAVEYNEGGSCFGEIDSTLKEHGYYMYDFGDMAYHAQLFRSPGVGQFDMLYVKPSSPHLPGSLKDTGFCGYRRDTKQKNAAAAATTASKGDGGNKKEDSGDNFDLESVVPDSTLDALERELELLQIKKRRRRPGIYFLLGFIVGNIFCFVVSITLFFYVKRKSSKGRPKFARKRLGAFRGFKSL